MKIVSIVLISVLFISTPTLIYADCQLGWCKKAKTTAEKTVCNSELLRSADALMNSLYKSILKNKKVLMGTRGAIKDEQREFLILRDEVAHFEFALQEIYIGRIMELQKLAKQYQDDH